MLDLDETLVHSSFKYVPNADFVLSIELTGRCYQIYVLKRPYADEFIKEMSHHYELVLFTASMPTYANAVMRKLDPGGRITLPILNRQHCI